jgi:hypothetical protein
MNAKTQHTQGPWFVSGVRHKMNDGEWHGINRYDEAKKCDENIACVGYDPRTGLGWADARLIAAAPDLLAAIKDMIDEFDDVTVTDDIKTQVGWSANTIKALQRARAAIAKASQP